MNPVAPVIVIFISILFAQPPQAQNSLAHGAPLPDQSLSPAPLQTPAGPFRDCRSFSEASVQSARLLLESCEAPTLVAAHCAGSCGMSLQTGALHRESI